jgi:hypothetical protein
MRREEDEDRKIQGMKIKFQLSKEYLKIQFENAVKMFKNRWR